MKNDKTSLYLTLGTKIGVGSIIGTTSSIIIGGFSSVVWILVFSFITTSIIYYESYLGRKNRVKLKDDYIGGPNFITKNPKIPHKTEEKRHIYPSRFHLRSL